jgi:hypothetical protein
MNDSEPWPMVESQLNTPMGGYGANSPGIGIRTLADNVRGMNRTTGYFRGLVLFVICFDTHQPDSIGFNPRPGTVHLQYKRT